MKQFTEPEFDILILDAVDVICASNEDQLDTLEWA